MSEENVEIVRDPIEAVSAFLRADIGSEAFSEVVDPQIEVHWGDEPTFPDFPQHLAGAPEFVEVLAQLRRAWVDPDVEILEVIEVPDDRVLTLLGLSGRGRDSGVPLVIHYFQLWTIREGAVGKLELFRHRDTTHRDRAAEPARMRRSTCAGSM